MKHTIRCPADLKFASIGSSSFYSTDPLKATASGHTIAVITRRDSNACGYEVMTMLNT